PTRERPTTSGESTLQVSDVSRVNIPIASAKSETSIKDLRRFCGVKPGLVMTLVTSYRRGPGHATAPTDAAPVDCRGGGRGAIVRGLSPGNPAEARARQSSGEGAVARRGGSRLSSLDCRDHRPPCSPQKGGSGTDVPGIDGRRTRQGDPTT